MASTRKNGTVEECHLLSTPFFLVSDTYEMIGKSDANFSFQFFRSGLLGSLSGPTFPSSIPRRFPSCIRPKMRSRTKLVSLIRRRLLLPRLLLRNKLELMNRQLRKE